jgi:hypothetical protein
MIIAIDFDGTLVHQEHAYDDLDTPLTFLPGAREGVLALQRAGHVLLLYSARANLALRKDWRLNPLWARGAVLVPLDRTWWQGHVPLAEARYRQMVEFVERELPGVFIVDDGAQGKPTGVDVFIDDRNFGTEYIDWAEIEALYGEPEHATENTSSPAL